MDSPIVLHGFNASSIQPTLTLLKSLVGMKQEMCKHFAQLYLSKDRVKQDISIATTYCRGPDIYYTTEPGGIRIHDDALQLGFWCIIL